MSGQGTITRHQPGQSFKLEFGWENFSSRDQFLMLSLIFLTSAAYSVPNPLLSSFFHIEISLF